jgi:hypothetical protein
MAAAIAVLAVGGASYSVASRAIWDRGVEPESTFALVSGSGFGSAAVDVSSLGVSSEVTEIDDQIFADLLSRIENLPIEMRLDPKPLVRAPRSEGGLQ